MRAPRATAMSEPQSEDAYCHLWGGGDHGKFQYASVMANARPCDVGW